MEDPKLKNLSEDDKQTYQKFSKSYFSYLEKNKEFGSFVTTHFYFFSGIKGLKTEEIGYEMSNKDLSAL